MQAIALHLGMESHQQINWANFKQNSLHSLIEVLKQKELAPKTIALYVSVVKGITEQAYFMQLISRLELDAIQKVEGTVGHRLKEHKVISREEFNNLLQNIERSTEGNAALGARNLALFHIMTGTGLRRTELVNLQMHNINDKHIRVIGKGNKERKVVLHPITKAALDEWLKYRGFASGAVFHRVSKAGNVIFNDKSDPTKGLSGSAIYDLCQKYNTIPPHSMRRTYATWLFSNDVRLDRISKQLGHSNLSTTELYIIDDEGEIYNDIVSNLY
jgi:integrase